MRRKTKEESWSTWQQYNDTAWQTAWAGFKAQENGVSLLQIHRQNSVRIHASVGNVRDHVTSAAHKQTR